MATRYLTKDEINNIIIPQILEKFPELESREKQIFELNKLLKNKHIAIDISSILTNVLIDDDNSEDKLKFVLNHLQSMKSSIPDAIGDIINYINKELNFEDRYFLALNYATLNDIYSDDQLIEINQNSELISYDYLTIIQDFIDELDDNDLYKDDIQNNLNDYIDEPEELLEYLQNIISEQTLAKEDDPSLDISTIDRLKALLKGNDDLIYRYRVDKLLGLELITGNSKISDVLRNSNPSADTKIQRLLEYFKDDQSLDIAGWLIELLEGKIREFSQVKSEYERFTELLHIDVAEEDEEDEEEYDNSFNSNLISDMIKLYSEDEEDDTIYEILIDHPSYKNDDFRDSVIDNVSTLYDALNKAIEAFSEYLEDAKVLGTRKLDIYTLLDILNLMVNGELIGDYRINALRGILGSIEINDNLQDFIDDYLNNMPRILHDHEINEILSVLPLPIGDIDIAKSVRDSIAFTLKKYLSTIKITPKGIDDLKQLIKIRFEKARQIAGRTVGVHSASSIGAMVTQMTLNSVDWNEIVYIKQNNDSIILGPIGKFIDDIIDNSDNIKHYDNETEYVDVSINNYEVTSVDEDGKMHWKKLEAVTRHLPGGKMVKIKTRSGRSVIATKSKSFLVRENNKIVPKKGSDIEVGDKVPIVLEAPNSDITLDYINMDKYFSKLSYIYGSEMNKMKNYKHQSHDKYWWANGLNKHFTVPYKRGDTAYDGLTRRKGGYIDGIIYPLRNGHYISKIPEKLPLDNLTGFLFGIYLSEGCLADNYVSISNNNDYILDKVAEFCNKYGIGYHTVVQNNKNFEGAQSKDIRIHSKILSKLLYMTCGKGSSNKRIPDWSIISNIDFIKGLLDGYFSGDGTVSKRDKYISASSASSILLVGISELCMKFRIFGKLSQHIIKSNNIGSTNIKPCNTFSIRNDNATNFAINIPLTHKSKQKLLNTIKDKKWSEGIGTYDIIPGVNCSSFNGDIKRRIIKTFINNNPDHKDIELLLECVNNDVYFDEIVSIEEVDSSHPKVYDFTVADTRNFTIFGGLCVRDTFHKAGSALNVTGGIERTNELITVRKEPKSASCTVFYEPKIPFETSREYLLEIGQYDDDSKITIFNNIGYTFEEILSKSNELVGLTVSDLFYNEPEIESRDIIFEDGKPWWYSAYSNLNELGNLEPTWVMRLRLNPVLMYKYNILIEDIVSAISTGTWKNSNACRSSHCMDIIYSPNGSGIKSDKASFVGNIPIIDIFPDEDKLGKVLENVDLAKSDNSFQFLQKIVEPSFKNIHIQGVNGIKQTFVDKINVWDVVEYYKLMETTEDGTIWNIYLNDFKIRELGIYNINVAKLCYVVGMQILDISEDGSELQVIISNEYNYKNPQAMVNSIISDDLENASEHQEEMMSKKVIPSRRPENLISTSAYYYYTITVGSNLREVLIAKDVDDTITYCNNPYEYTSIFGIEAGRNRLLKELVKVFSQEGNLGINPRHVILLADFMSAHGELVPLTFGGINRQPTGFFSKATYEHAADALAFGALKQSKESTKNVSVAIGVGKPPEIGTGIIDIKIDREKLSEMANNIDIDEEEIREEYFKQSIENMTRDDTIYSANVDETFEQNLYPNTDLEDDINVLSNINKPNIGKDTKAPPRPKPTTNTGLVMGDEFEQVAEENNVVTAIVQPQIKVTKTEGNKKTTRNINTIHQKPPTKRNPRKRKK